MLYEVFENSNIERQEYNIEFRTYLLPKNTIIIQTRYLFVKKKKKT